MQEVYPEQFKPYIRHTMVGAPHEKQWTTPDLLCYSVYALQANGDEQNASVVNQLMVSGLLVNGLIETWMRMQREGKV